MSRAWIRTSRTSTTWPPPPSKLGWLAPAGLIAHSALDGVAIGLGFEAGPEVGLVVTIAVLVHDFADGLNIVTLALAMGRGRGAAIALLAIDAAATLVGIGISQVIVARAGAAGHPAGRLRRRVHRHRRRPPAARGGASQGRQRVAPGGIHRDRRVDRCRDANDHRRMNAERSPGHTASPTCARLRRCPGGRRRQLRGPPRRGLRPARAKRRRQDDDDRDPRGPQQGGQWRDCRARHRPATQRRRAEGAHRRPAPDAPRCTPT